MFPSSRIKIFFYFSKLIFIATACIGMVGIPRQNSVCDEYSIFNGLQCAFVSLGIELRATVCVGNSLPINGMRFIHKLWYSMNEIQSKMHLRFVIFMWLGTLKRSCSRVSYILFSRRDN